MTESPKQDLSISEIGFYYPGPIWASDRIIKNLILFFDGLALLVPNYLLDKPGRVDPAIVLPLKEKGLLHIIEPEVAIDKNAAEALATALTNVLTAGILDNLDKETQFAELSYSRLGAYGDQQLAEMLLEELKRQGLARDSEDGVSIPMHPLVRNIILVLLSQILRPYGQKIHSNLSPVTDNFRMYRALQELLETTESPSAGNVVSFDLETVGADLSGIPLDEILDFRQQNRSQLVTYTFSVKQFVRELSLMPDDERIVAMEERQKEILEIASDLRKASWHAWKRPAFFALSIAGAAWSISHGDPIGTLLGLGGAIVSAPERQSTETGAYSFIFRATDQF